MAFSLFKARNQAYGGSLRDKRVQDQMRWVSVCFPDLFSFSEVSTYRASDPEVAVATQLSITDDSKIKEQKSVVYAPSSVAGYGDLHVWRGAYWLMTHMDLDFGDVYHRGVMVQCFSSIKWIDALGVLREVPFCSKFNQESNFGVDEDRILRTPNERRNITVQNNRYTREIRKDMRFIFDGRAWRVIAKNTLEAIGTITFVLLEHVLDPSHDDVENRIANVRKVNWSIVVKNGLRVPMGVGEQVALDVVVKDGSQVIAQEVKFESLDETVATVDASGVVRCVGSGIGGVRVRVESYGVVATEDVVIDASLGASTRPVLVIEGSPVIRLAAAEMYTVLVMVGGVADVQAAVNWQVLDLSGNVSDLLVVDVVSSRQVRVVAHATQQGYARLVASLGSDASVKTELKIRVRGLW